MKTTYSVSINDEAAEVLEMIREASPHTTANDRVFCWEMNSRTLYRHASQHQELAGFPESRRFKFHSVRKHFGSEIALINPMAATKALGHSNPTVTARYYMNRKQVVAPAVGKIKPLGDSIDKVTVAPVNAPAVLPTQPVNHIKHCCGSVTVFWG